MTLHLFNLSFESLEKRVAEKLSKYLLSLIKPSKKLILNSLNTELLYSLSYAIHIPRIYQKKILKVTGHAFFSFFFVGLPSLSTRLF